MKAVICNGHGGPDVLKLADVPAPSLKEGQVLIRVHATACNGADTMQRLGKYPPPPGASELLGLEAAGEVEETGPGAKRFKKGDRVMALLDGGGYAEKVAAPEAFCMPLPQHFSFQQGAAVPETWLTAYLELVMLGELQSGQSVLIHAGASGVGTAAIQIAKQLGAKVFVTASSAEKLAYCKDLGADVLINYKQEDFAAVVKEQTATQDLQGVPGGNKQISGVNVILDLVGASHFAKNLDSLAVEGRLLLVGLPSGMKAECNLGLVLLKRLRIIGSTLRARPTPEKSAIVQRFAEYALPLFESGVFKPQIDCSFPLAEASKAHQHMGDAKNKGKILLTV